MTRLVSIVALFLTILVMASCGKGPVEPYADFDYQGSDQEIIFPDIDRENDGDTVPPSDEEGLLPDEETHDFNHKPIANPGINKAAIIGNMVKLDGSKSSDGDGNPLTFFWTIESAPEGSIAVLVDSNKSIAYFTPDVKGEYKIQLVVNDGKVNSDPATVKVTVVKYTEITYSTSGPVSGKEFKVYDAAYSKQLDKIVMVSHYPNPQVIVYDTSDNSYETLKLPLQPWAVSISPDGEKAAVAQDSWIAIINLHTPIKVEKEIQAFGIIHDLAYGRNGYVYFSPAANWYDAIYTVNIATGQVAGVWAGVPFYEDGTTINEQESSVSTIGSWIVELNLKFHPNGCHLYASVAGISNEDNAKLRIFDVCGAWVYREALTCVDPDTQEEKKCVAGVLSDNYPVKNPSTIGDALAKPALRSQYVIPNYNMYGDLWMGEEKPGNPIPVRVFAQPRGNAFNASFDPTQSKIDCKVDLPDPLDPSRKILYNTCYTGITGVSYVGSLQESNDYSVKFLYDSAAVNTAVVVSEAADTTKDNQVELYDDTYLQYLGSIEMPIFTDNNSGTLEEFPARADFSFFNSDGSNVYVVTHRYNSTKTINNYGVIVIEDWENLE